MDWIASFEGGLPDTYADSRHQWNQPRRANNAVNGFFVERALRAPWKLPEAWLHSGYEYRVNWLAAVLNVLVSLAVIVVVAVTWEWWTRTRLGGFRFRLSELGFFLTISAVILGCFVNRRLVHEQSRRIEKHPVRLSFRKSHPELPVYLARMIGYRNCVSNIWLSEAKLAPYTESDRDDYGDKIRRYGRLRSVTITSTGPCVERLMQQLENVPRVYVLCANADRTFWDQLATENSWREVEYRTDG